MLEFLARVTLSEKSKRPENSISVTYLFSFKKDFANFQVKVQKKNNNNKKNPKKQKNNTGRIRKTFKANKNKVSKTF